ncbi:MAG: hypothetical protein WCK63_18995 [Betaproteobacteria bacterium]
MKNMSTSKISKKKKSNDEEKLLILAQTDQVKGEQLLVMPEGLVAEYELKNFALGLDDDPEKKYEIYNKGITKLLRKHLEKGKENKMARDFIYEEKNTFLTRGKRKRLDGTRGGDSRMGYISDQEELLNIIIAWIVSNGTMVELFSTLRNLNIAKNYGKASV